MEHITDSTETIDVTELDHYEIKNQIKDDAEITTFVVDKDGEEGTPDGEYKVECSMLETIEVRAWDDRRDKWTDYGYIRLDADISDDDPEGDLIWTADGDVLADVLELEVTQ